MPTYENRVSVRLRAVIHRGPIDVAHDARQTAVVEAAAVALKALLEEVREAAVPRVLKGEARGQNRRPQESPKAHLILLPEFCRMKHEISNVPNMRTVFARYLDQNTARLFKLQRPVI
jgi:anti-sigma factor RsiW